jgi:hypothetical protein
MFWYFWTRWRLDSCTIHLMNYDCICSISLRYFEPIQSSSFQCSRYYHPFSQCCSTPEFRSKCVLLPLFRCHFSELYPQLHSVDASLSPLNVLQKLPLSTCFPRELKPCSPKNILAKTLNAYTCRLPFPFTEHHT